MTYAEVIPARFLARPNRFIARVEIAGEETEVHVKNTGRCRELLIPGCPVYLARSRNPARKTQYDLIAVRKLSTGELVNLDSQVANDAAAEWLARGTLFPRGAVIRREVTRGGSRFDFCIEQAPHGPRTYLEVKGVTLEEGGVARFPDAPTVRGVKHLRELTALCLGGEGACLLFVVQMKGVRLLRPNDRTDPAFGEALRAAAAAGVKLLAMDCRVEPDSITLDAPVPIALEPTHL